MQVRTDLKKVKITVHGRIIYSAHRTFEIEVPDDENVQLYDTNTVSDLADEARAAWRFSEDGLTLADEHTIESVTDAEESSPTSTDEKSPATLDINDPRIARICSLFGIDPNQHDPGLGDEPPVSF
jgi:hypothetical protein